MSHYDKRGVSSQKEDVHKAIKNIDKGLFPNAFCKILPDHVGNDADWCTAIHADGAGTKSSLAYLYWKETGDLSVWKGIAQDALVMNLDDMLCAGLTGPFIFSSTIGRNKHLIPAEVISQIINGTEELIADWKKHGVNIISGGGETADVGDLTRTIIVDSTLFVRNKRAQVIEIDLQDGDELVGIASFGQANYENEYNAGMGSNGLTSARHDLFNKEYKTKYPESCDPNTDDAYVYTGPYSLTDSLEGTPLNMGKAVLSPTRTYAPFIIELLNNRKADIHGMIHCTGGGQTKIMHFNNNNMHVIKDNLFDTPPLFDAIQKASNANTKEMFEVFNMGHRLEIAVPKGKGKEIVAMANNWGLDAQIIGRVEASNVKKLTINHNSETYIW